MYFVVADMGEVDPMYQFSLKYFKQVSRLSIRLLYNRGQDYWYQFFLVTVIVLAFEDHIYMYIKFEMKTICNI